jgi:hypothetical protein
MSQNANVAYVVDGSLRFESGMPQRFERDRNIDIRRENVDSIIKRFDPRRGAEKNQFKELVFE